MLADAQVEALSALGSLNERLRWLSDAGLESELGAGLVLDSAEAWVYRDPGTTARLAELGGRLSGRLHVATGMARADYLRGVALAAQGEYDEALSAIEEARSRYESNDDRSSALRTAVGRAGVLASAGRYLEGELELDLVLEMLDVDPGLDLAGHVGALARQNLGTMLIGRGRLEEGSVHLDAAATAHEQVGDLDRVVQVTSNRTPALIALGKASEAISNLTRLVALVDPIADAHTHAVLSEELGSALLASGELATAVDLLSQSTESYGTAQMTGEARRARLLLAKAYLELHLDDEVGAMLMDLEAELDDDDHPHQRAIVLSLRATLDAALGQWTRAEEGFGLAAGLYNELGFEFAEASCRLDQAAVLRRSGNSEDSLLIVSAEAERARERGWLAHLALAELAIADSAVSPSESEEVLVRAGEAVDRAGLEPLRYLLDLGWASVRQAQGRVGDAIHHLEAAVAAVESTRRSLRLERHRRAFLAGELEVYQRLFENLVSVDDIDATRRAFEVAEQAKSRALLDRISGVLETAPADVDETALQQLRRDLDGLYSRLMDNDGPVRGVSAQFDVAVAVDLEHKLLDLIERAGPDYRSGVPALGADEVEAAALCSGTTMVVFHAIEHSLYAFVTAGRGIQLVQLDATVPEIECLVRRMRAQFERFRMGAEFARRRKAELGAAARDVLGALHDLLWRPLDSLVSPGKETVLVVPAGPLHDVPFHALWTGSHHLIEKLQITVAPSAAVWVAANDKAPARGSSVLLQADERLRHTSRESEHARRSLDGLGLENVTVSDLQDIGMHPNPTVLHLACHGVHRADNPAFSALRLTSGWLTSADAAKLEIEGTTVVLSACDSGRGAWSPGEEMMGLTRALLAAGAKAIVATGWLVDDAAAADLMASMYSGLAAGETVSASLRCAGLEAMALTGHPFMWAPFFVIGDGDRPLSPNPEALPPTLNTRNSK